MKKTQNGITLVALIITIVVLLILAVVSIGAIKDSNIVGYAQNAAGGYDKAKGDENNTIAGYENILNQYATGGNSVGSTGEGDVENPEEPVVDTTLSLGRTIYYDSNNDNQKEEWIVYSITDENNFEIISANTMGSLTLGYDDPKLPETVGDLSGNGIAEENLDKAIWSYNNAIKTINDYCNEIVMATDHSGVRSIGASTVQDTAGYYQGAGNAFKDSDTYGQNAINYLINLNCLTSKDSNNYWIASRRTALGGAWHFGIYQVSLNEDVYDSNINDWANVSQIVYVGLLGLKENGVCSEYAKSAGVRPIITNPVNYSFTN